MSEENVEKIRKGVDAFNRRDFDTALADLADDVTWEGFLSRTETQLRRGKEQIRAAWKSQVEMLDIRAEPEEFIAIGTDRVVVPTRLVARGKSSEMPLVASIAWVYTLGVDGLARSVEAFDTREEALEAARLRE